MPHPRCTFLLLGLLVCLIGSPSVLAIAKPSTNDAYEQANQLHSKDQAVEAIIALKNALQADPNHLPSLILAGQIYLEQALGLAAEDSLRTALAAGADRNLVLPMLGEALLQQGKSLRLLGELFVDGLSPIGQARIHTLRAQALMLQGKMRDARTELDAANAVAPGNFEARLIDITWQMNNGESARGIEQLAALIKEHGTKGEVWSLSGAIHHARGEFAEALKDYATALVRIPRNLDVRIAKIGLLIDLNRDGETADDFDYLKREFPNEPRAAYLRSIVAARAGKTEEVDDALKSALTALAPLEEESYAANPALYLIKGLSHYGLRQFESAIPALQAYISKRPADVGARKALGDALLKTNAAADAVTVLQAAVERQPQDERAQVLLATAYAVTGMGDKAAELLEHVAGAGKTNPAVRTRLAMINIGAGRIEQGMSELAASFAHDPTDAQGGIALVVSSLKAKKSAQAVAAATKLLATGPENPIYINLLGIALFMDGQLNAARSQFESALARDPKFAPAAINLGKLELKERQFDAARNRFKQLLAASPNDVKLLVEASRVEFAAGDQRQGMRLAEAAAQPTDTSLEAIFYLYDLQMAAGKLDKAYELALRAAHMEATNFDVLERLAQVQLRMNRRDDMRGTLKRMSEAALYDVDKQLRTAGYMASVEQFGDVEYVLFKALQQNPGNRTVQLARVDNSLRKKSFAEALERADALLAEASDFAPAFYLRGESLMALQRFEEALADFDKANKLFPSADAVLGGYRALRSAGRTQQARARLEAWQADHEKDLPVRMALAEDFVQGGEYAPARDVYKALIAQRPHDAALLNNYAYVSLQLGETVEALRAAEQAHKLEPENAMVSDTLGWVLFKAERAEEGLPHLREASARASDDGEIHYHLAVALHGLGRRKEAQDELERALGSGRDFASKQQARELLETLKGPSSQ